TLFPYTTLFRSFHLDGISYRPSIVEQLVNVYGRSVLVLVWERYVGTGWADGYVRHVRLISSLCVETDLRKEILLIRFLVEVGVLREQLFLLYQRIVLVELVVALRKADGVLRIAGRYADEKQYHPGKEALWLVALPF